MLIRFEVANFRSILDPVELSMVAVDRDRPEARPVENIGESLLPVAAIYGPNASGKSNIIAALTWLCDAVWGSFRYWDGGIPVEPFATSEAMARPSQYTVELTIEDIRFEYVAEVTNEEVLYEGLFHYPEKKRRRIFERDKKGLTLQRGLGNLSGTRELLTPRTLALSVARRFGEPLVSRFAEVLAATTTLGITQSRSSIRRILRSTPTTSDLFDENADRQLELPGLVRPTHFEVQRERALELLKLADLGIDDVLVEREPLADSSGQLDRATVRLRLLHRLAGQSLAFDIRQESAGTRTWFGLIASVLQALDLGSLLLFDELDASLHPTLSAELIRLFTDPASNPRNAQLVFTSHDTSLLNHLNRDEVWLTEKVDGMTRLGALAEFAGERVRRSQNLERAYLGGRFGALPEINRAEMLRALGLIG